MLSEGIDHTGVIFVMTILPLMAIPGMLASFYGIRLFREFTESSLKWVIGAFAIFLAFFLSARVSLMMPLLISERLQSSIVLFITSLISIIAYLFVIRYLLKRFSDKERNLSSLLSRGILILMAWQLWLLLSQVFDEYSPIKKGYTPIREQPWDILGLVVPIVVAYGAYCLVAPRITQAQQSASCNH